MLVLQSEQMPRQSSQLPLLLTVLQAAILMVLVVLAPFVMRFDPPAGLGRDVWTTYHDPQAVLRFFLIALGVLSPLVCVGATILTWQHNERPPYLLLIQIAFTLAVFAIGWRAYPYWANGIYHAFQEAGSMQSLYDPKALAPFHWVGVGSLMVPLTLLLIEFPVILVAGFAVLLEALRRGVVSATRRNERHSTATSAWFFSAMVILVPLLIMLVIQFVLTPGYGTWIAD